MRDPQYRNEHVPARQFQTFALGEDDSLMAPDEMKHRIKLAVSERVSSPDLKIPMLPHVASRVMQLANDPMVSLNVISELLKQDQQLAGKLIQVANSPVYAGLSKITSIQRAVLQVGLRTLRDLLVSVAFGGTIFRNVQYRDRMNETWRHSLAVAHISQEVARAVGIDNEYAFLCGLMHDVGKPLLVDILVDLSRAMKDKVFLSDELVTEVLDEFHEAVGGLIARKWAFPSLLHDAVAFHHHTAEAASSTQMACLVHVADLFYYHLGLSPNPQAVDLPNRKAVYELGLNPGQIQDLESKLAASVPLFLSGFRP